MRLVRNLAATFFVALGSQAALAQGPAWIEILPQFVGQGWSGGCFDSYKVGISGDGDTVLGALQNGSAGTWSRSGGVQELPRLPGWTSNHWAVDANTDGSIVAGTGQHATNVTFGVQAMQWSSVGIEGLGPPPECLFFCQVWAAAMSRNGSVIVGDYTRNNSYGAFMGDPSNGLTLLPLRFARGISDDGSVVVGAAAGDGHHSAAYWRSTPQPFGTVQVLPDISGAGDGGCATAVSANAQVIVGYGGQRPFRWTSAGGSVDLGELEGATAAGYATDVSADGAVVVGQSAGQAFVWDASAGMRSLAEELTLRGADLTGIVTSTAIAMSDDGSTIVGVQASPGRVWVAYLPPDCSDGIDNDGDGAIDWPSDPGCQTEGSRKENPACQNGADDDNDGKIDFDGGAAANGGVPLGSPDPACADRPYRSKETGSSGCGIGAEIALALALIGWRAKPKRTYTD